MNATRLLACLAASVLLSGTPLMAQTISEVPAMTVLNSRVDMDTVGTAGPTTVAAINAAGQPMPANIANITLTPNIAALGLYNTNPQGLALGLWNNGLELIPVNGSFTATDARIDLGQASTEFGISIGDWAGAMILTFFSNNVQVAVFTSSSFSTTIKYFRMTGGTFDRVDVIASSTVGNWVMPDLVVENSGAIPFGQGCGAGGGPRLSGQTAPVIGTTFNLALGNVAANRLAWHLFGFSNQLGPFGPLPFDMGVLFPSMAGCNLLVSTDWGIVGPALITGTQLALPMVIPNNPGLVNFHFFCQGMVADPAGPALSLVMSNGLDVTVR